MNPTEWLEAHEAELPQMTDGSRVNGDPIICFGSSRDHRLMALLRKRTNREDASFKDDLILHRLLRDAMANPVDNRTWIRVFRAIGMTQAEIARELGCNRSTVSRQVLRNRQP